MGSFQDLGISQLVKLPLVADTQSGTYHLTITSNSGGNAAADKIASPLQGDRKSVV